MILVLLMHALLHSKWIENMYQHGEGKPYRKVIKKKKNKESWQYKKGQDPVANLVRELWFRYEENFQLLPTKKGYLSCVDTNNIGKIFVKIINCVYRNFDQDSKSAVICAIFSEKEREIKRYQQILQESRFDDVRQSDEMLWAKKRETAKQLGQELVWTGEKARLFGQKIKDAEKEYFKNIGNYSGAF